MQTITLLGALLKENVESGYKSLPFRTTDLLNLLAANGRVEAGKGAEPYSWEINSGANSSVESFAEGQAPPVAGAQTWKRTSLSVLVNARAVFGMTGHVRDNLAKNGYYAESLSNGVPSVEEALTCTDVAKQVEDLLMGSTTDVGLAAIIDATGSYAGINQSSVSSWASEENSVGGALTLSAMQDLYEEMVSPAGGSSVPRGAQPTHWLMPVNQIGNYVALGGFAGSANAAFRFRGGDKLDLSVAQQGFSETSYMGIPIARVSGLTSTEIYLVDVMDMTFLVHRDMTVDPIAGNPENLQWQVSMRGALKVERRNHHGKMTGVTA